MRTNHFPPRNSHLVHRGIALLAFLVGLLCSESIAQLQSPSSGASYFLWSVPSNTSAEGEYTYSNTTVYGSDGNEYEHWSGPNGEHLLRYVYVDEFDSSNNYDVMMLFPPGDYPDPMYDAYEFYSDPWGTYDWNGNDLSVSGGDVPLDSGGGDPGTGDPGSDPGTDPGTDPGDDPYGGTDPGTDPGGDPGTGGDGDPVGDGGGGGGTTTVTGDNVTVNVYQNASGDSTSSGGTSTDGEGNVTVIQNVTFSTAPIVTAIGETNQLLIALTEAIEGSPDSPGPDNPATLAGITTAIFGEFIGLERPDEVETFDLPAWDTESMPGLPVISTPLFDFDVMGAWVALDESYNLRMYFTLFLIAAIWAGAVHQVIQMFST